MPRSSSPAPPSASSHGHARDAVALGPSSTTPHPPEDVVMTSKIEFTRDTRDRPIINQYLIGHRLGNGQHGEVYKGYDMRRGNMLVAIKVCRRKNTKEAKYEQLRQRNQGAIPRTVGGFGGVSTRPRLVDQLQSTEKKVLREIAIMKKCKHGQIVQLYEVINDRLTSKIFLVLEYMGGGEVKWRDEQGRPCLRVDQTRRICRDVVLGLLYLHHQGIIHRDIKPANLLWTSDRMNVKITDFGVSHFSAAQRIDALKRSSAYREALEHVDPILLDDGGLSRQAGTPSFLAPEIIWEFDQNSLDLPSEATPTHLKETYSTMPDPDPNSFNDYNAIIAAGELDPETDAELPPRPPITKAIDVWALGVTLYCLLFGRTPWGGNTEFAMYQMIHTEDFVVDTFMGYDRIPTGGRFHDDDDTSEGAIVIGLLDRLLEKECSKRITLEEVKRLPWITRDIPNPDEWVAETSPD
ncbi:kinase-like protein, partial [Fomitiporia mediterranea MF3/22]|uniref:kinase-like protein n=1 Tax=Fomitiporia mediterranea (strain MF3/22) TaxID=694068 RepID=UPI0004409021